MLFRSASVVVALEGIVDPHNTAAILRSADAFGVGELHFIDLGVRPLVAKRITRGTERWLDVHLHHDPAGCVAGLKARGFEVFVADARATVGLDDIAARPRVAVVFGNEHQGASAATRAAATGTFAIPMRGLVESLNVSVAAAITLQRVTRHRPGDLGAHEARALRARFLLESVREHALVIERYLRDQRAGS